MKSQSPLLGFNNNVRHRGRVFHIQTEDSGIRHPHIITHLFADGGRILKTTKTSYAEHVGETNISETVRAMMQEQHKGMFIALRDGQFDHLFEDERKPKGSTPGIPAPAPSDAARPPVQAPAAPQILVALAPDSRNASPTAATAPQLDAQREDGTTGRRSNSRPRLNLDPNVLQPPTDREREVEALGHAKTAPPPENKKSEPPRGPQSTRRTTPPINPEVDIDLDTLQRAAVEASQTPVYRQLQDLPPPPAAVLGKKPGPTAAAVGNYSVASPRPPSDQPRPPMKSEPEVRARTGVPVEEKRAPQAPAPAASPGRYAPSRPAAIFATTRPQEGASIFGEDLISEKSLDEVILSYLAEDLEGESKK